MLLSRYADLLILHSLEGWVLLPQLIWRFNLYTDPAKTGIGGYRCQGIWQS